MGYHLIDLLLWYFGLPNRVMADFSATAVPGAGYDAEDTAFIASCYESKTAGRYIDPKEML